MGKLGEKEVGSRDRFQCFRLRLKGFGAASSGEISIRADYFFKLL